MLSSTTEKKKPPNDEQVCRTGLRNFNEGKWSHNYQDVYLLAASNDTDPSAMDGATKDIEGWIECFDGVTLKGVVKGTGANDVGDILNHKDKLEEAYNYGKNV